MESLAEFGFLSLKRLIKVGKQIRRPHFPAVTDVLAVATTVPLCCAERGWCDCSECGDRPSG